MITRGGICSPGEQVRLVVKIHVLACLPSSGIQTCHSGSQVPSLVSPNGEWKKNGGGGQGRPLWNSSFWLSLQLILANASFLPPAIAVLDHSEESLSSGVHLGRSTVLSTLPSNHLYAIHAIHLSSTSTRMHVIHLSSTSTRTAEHHGRGATRLILKLNKALPTGAEYRRT